MERRYRNRIRSDKLISFQVQVLQTDLFVRAEKNLEQRATDLVVKSRSNIEKWSRDHPDFLTSLKPLKIKAPAYPPVNWMLKASGLTGVGPMAAVAGAIAEYVGRGLMDESPNIVIENGGDIFLAASDEMVVGLFSGGSAESMKLGLLIQPDRTPLGVCTSSGAIGHSLSYGRADAATVVADEAALADAAATALCNRIQIVDDIEPALSWALSISGVRGAAVVLNKHIGLLGDLEIVRLQ